MRTVKYILLSLMVIILLLITTVYAVFNNNSFQNWLGGKLSGYLSAQFKTKISIGHISYKPFTTFQLNDVLFGDQKNDTLFYAGALDFNLGGFYADSSRLVLKNVKVDRGYCNIVTYKDGTFNISVLDNISDLSDTIPDTISPPFTLYFDKVSCTNTRFRFVNETDTFSPEGFDGINEYFYQVNAEVENFWIIEDSLSMDIKRLSCLERSGLVVNKIKAKTIISPKGMVFDKLELITPQSHIKGDFSMKYNSWDEMGDFNNTVKLKANISGVSVVDIKDVAIFAPALKTYAYKARISGKASGPISNLRMRDLDVRFGAVSRFRGDVDLNGLPDIENTFIDIKAKNALTNRTDLEYIIDMKLPVELDELGLMRFEGKYTGFYKDFVAYGDLKTDLGRARSDLNMKLGDDPGNIKAYTYSGNLELIDFDMGRLAGIKNIVGFTSLKASVRGTGLELDGMKAGLQSTMEYIDVNGYRYKNVKLDGYLADKILSGALSVHEENIILGFNGLIDLGQKIPRFNFTADVTNANLHNLKLDTGNITASFHTDIDFAWKDLDNNSGTIVVNNLQLERGEEEFDVKEISLYTENAGESRKISLKSDGVEVGMRGAFNFAALPASFYNTFRQLIPRYLGPEKIRTTNETERFSFEANIRTLHPFDDLFFPHFNVENTKLTGSFDEQANRLQLNGMIGELKYGVYGLNHVELKNDIVAAHEGNLLVGIGEVRISDTIMVRDLAFLGKLKDDRAALSMIAHDEVASLQAEIRADAEFLDDSVRTVFKESSFIYRNNRFDLSDQSIITYVDHGFVFTDFEVVREGNQVLRIDGLYDLKEQHDVKAEVRNLHLDIVNMVFPGMKIGVNGVVNGTASIKGVEDVMMVTSDMTIRNLALDKDTIGDFKLLSNYNEKQKRLLMYASSSSGKLKNLELGGYYSFAGNEDELNFNLYFDESDITSFKAFVKDYVTIYAGDIKAKCRLTGSIAKPGISGDVELLGVTARIEYLKTLYSFSSVMHFDLQQISIEPTEIRDINDRKATLSGIISHNHFSNLVYNLHLDNLNRFQVLNTTSKDNDLFYGTAYVDGELKLSGPQNDLQLDVKMTTRSGTLFNIPLSEDDGSSDNELLHYISKDTIKVNTQTVASSISGFSINCMLRTTRDAEIQIVFDEQQGDKIRGRGTGDLRLELTRQGNFNMYGEVVIDEGDYRFTAMNIFTKKFVLSKGGTISWTGDPLQGRMNIEGVYQLRASLAEVVNAATDAEKESLRQQRVPVDCKLYLKGNLLNPDIRFDMNFPDLQGVVSGNSSSELQNTLRVWRNDQAQMDQQVISLMLFGRFVPTNLQNTASTSNNITAGVNNTLSGFMSAQASAVMQQIIPGLDVNVDFQSGNDVSRSRTILSASKRWFNNRLELQGSIDPQNTYQNWLTQYNLTKDGNLKVKGFSRSTLDPIYNRNINTQGVGLYYRKEFDNFSDLFKRKKTQQLNF